VSVEGVEELLPTYVSGELPDEERARVEVALAGSPRLRDEVSRYETLFVLLATAAAEELEAPANLQARIARQVALKSYLGAAARLVEGLLGVYGRAVIYYLGLG
jgi:anti-sigma factor RsiW